MLEMMLRDVTCILSIFFTTLLSKHPYQRTVRKLRANKRNCIPPQIKGR